MTEPVKLKITKAGLYSFFNARANGIKLELASMKYSSDHFESVIMDERTTLDNIVSESHIIASGTSVETNTIRFITVVNSAEDLNIGSVGVYTKEGILFAVASVTSGQLFRVFTGISFIASFGLTLTPQLLGDVVVSIDTNTPIFYSMMLDHENHVNPHPQYATNATVAGLSNRIEQAVQTIESNQQKSTENLFGVGQGYVNRAGQRANNGTLYVNKTNKPIMVYIVASPNDYSGTMHIYVDGVLIAYLIAETTRGSVYTHMPFSFTVAPNSGYSITGGQLRLIVEQTSEA